MQQPTRTSRVDKKMEDKCTSAYCLTPVRIATATRREMTSASKDGEERSLRHPVETINPGPRLRKTRWTPKN